MWCEPYLAVMIIRLSLYSIWWPEDILFGCHDNIKFKTKNKCQLLRNHWSSRTLIWYKCCLAKENSKWLKNIGGLSLDLVAIFGSYDHLIIVYPVYIFYDRWQCFCLFVVFFFFFLFFFCFFCCCFCFFCHGNIQFEKKDFFKCQLRNHYSSITPT